MIGTKLIRLERLAENIISADCIAGNVPNSSRKNITLFGSLPPISSAMESISLYNCCTIKEMRKYLLSSSSGIIKNTADLFLQNFSVLIFVSKQSSCSISESRKAFSLDNAVDSTDAIAWSEVFRAAPDSHLALCSSGRRSINSLN